jgi:helicase MOV-10
MTAREEKEQSKLDVYARPFVPHIFRAINQAPANILTSTPGAWIDFQAYIQQFAGSSFLTVIDTSKPISAPDYRTINSNHASQTARRDDLELDSRDLEPEKYEACFKSALEQEAIAQQQECDDHALYRVLVIRNNRDRDSRPNMHTLHVPGLREMSLRIEVGDIVQLRQLRVSARGEVLAPLVIKQPNGNSAHLPRHPEVQHNSVVWSIDRRSEMLSLRIDHLARMSMLFNVCFTVQSGRIQALHRAVTTAADSLSTETDESWMRSMLFPSPTDGYYQKTLNKFQLNFDLYDELLNYEQTKAVNTVLNEEYGPVPFIISGPPGTGKTKTIVELALQKISNNKTEHLLLCAPSDPAADTLVQRLSKHLGPSELLRINSPARSFPEVPSSILSYCCIEDGMFALPPLKELMRRRIVVTSCRDADVLNQARVSNADLFSLERAVYSAIHPNMQLESPVLHWTGLLIDEAAQATEPEALISLTVVAPPITHRDEMHWPIFVMAGDQHQLGPRTASKETVIQTSLFERLLNRSFYRDHPLSRSNQSGVMRPLTQEMLPILRPAFANLIRNYRSHPAILATPSSLFYNDTLEPEATATDSLLSWHGWKGAKWPVLFTCNSSPDEIEQDGGGWYNIAEANIACQYAHSFLQTGLLQPHEICIMSPFQAQVKVIRRLARENAMSGVNIGPLEAFQGLESRLVILCTTRTRDRFIDQDLAKGLGVIHEPKRFNVALTRAKEGLIVVGNPDVLKQDKNWTAFLAFCARNDLIDGAHEHSDFAEVGEGAAIVSRLEKQLLRRINGDDAAEGTYALSNGFRKLGFVENADHTMWESGVAIEASLRDRQKARERQLRSH